MCRIKSRQTLTSGCLYSRQTELVNADLCIYKRLKAASRVDMPTTKWTYAWYSRNNKEGMVQMIIGANGIATHVGIREEDRCDKLHVTRVGQVYASFAQRIMRKLTAVTTRVEVFM